MKAKVDPIRSRVMAAIRSKNTKPEMAVRKIVHALGYRFVLHRRDLPGSPDLAFPCRKKAIFVNGCFWHRHKCRFGAKAPRSNPAYWKKKFVRVVTRDAENCRQLRSISWQVLTIWECEIGKVKQLTKRLSEFLSQNTATTR
jgi:DNA mismatch endonuclease (patch repair protein)